MQQRPHQLAAMTAMVALGIVGGASAEASLIASDAFSTTSDGSGGTYSLAVTNSRIHGQNPTAELSGFTGAWGDTTSTATSDWRVEASSLTHALTTGTTAVGRAKSAGTNSDRTVFRSISSIPVSPTYYFSGLISSDSTSNDARFGLAANATSQSVVGTGVQIGVAGTDIKVWVNGTSTTVLTGYTLGETYFVVGQIDDNTGGDDSITVRVYGSTATDFNTPTATSSTITGEISSDLTSFTLSKGNTAGTGLKVDHFRFGTAESDVAAVPEPATLAMLAMGSLLATRRRR